MQSPEQAELLMAAASRGGKDEAPGESFIVGDGGGEKQSADRENGFMEEGRHSSHSDSRTRARGVCCTT